MVYRQSMLWSPPELHHINGTRWSLSDENIVESPSPPLSLSLSIYIFLIDVISKCTSMNVCIVMLTTLFKYVHIRRYIIHILWYTRTASLAIVKEWQR